MASRVMTETVAVTTTGSAGSATGSATSNGVNGFLLDVWCAFHDDAPATTDVTVAYGTPARGTIAVFSNSATDALKAPRLNAVDASGAAITGVYEPYPLDGTITVSVAQSDALAPAVTVYIRYLRPY